jgi:hypothetical protein
MVTQSTLNDDEVAMPKKEEFLGRLQKLARAGAPTRSGGHRAAFAAVRELVEAAVGDGYAVKLVWKLLRQEGRVTMSYETFLGHYRRRGLARRPAPAAAGTLASEDGPRRFVHSSVPRPRDKLV